MLRSGFAVILLLVFSMMNPALAGEQLIKKQSDFSFEETLEKFEQALADRGITLMSKVDHAANAASVDLTLPPTTLLIFGNPAAGTKLMQAKRSIALELPLKALVSEDEEGAIWVQYADIKHIAKRHGIDHAHPVVEKVSGVVDAVTTEATQAQTSSNK